jgi:hypothetical protein
MNIEISDEQIEQLVKKAVDGRVKIWFDAFVSQTSFMRDAIKEAVQAEVRIKVDESKVDVPKLASSNGGWIPTCERFPEDDYAVLVWCPERKNIYCASLEKGQWMIFGGCFERVKLEVTAWMPLPAPPQEIESEIKVGDEVMTLYKEHGIAVRDTYYIGLGDKEPFTEVWFGTTMSNCRVHGLVRTGRRFPQIAEIMEELRGAESEGEK